MKQSNLLTGSRLKCRRAKLMEGHRCGGNEANERGR
jgi:hypothetical protein